MAQPRTVLNTLLHEKKRKISGGCYPKMQVDFAYHSNHIEGCRLTHEQTRCIFETHTVDGVAHVNDIIEAVNHFKCFDCILDTIGGANYGRIYQASASASEERTTCR